MLPEKVICNGNWCVIVTLKTNLDVQENACTKKGLLRVKPIQTNLLNQCSRCRYSLGHVFMSYILRLLHEMDEALLQV